MSGETLLPRAQELKFFFGPSARINTKYSSGSQSNSLVIVKPHAVTEGNAGAIVDAIQERYRVTAAQLFTLERQNAQEFFEVYKGVVAPAEYSGMVEHLTSGLFLGAPSPLLTLPDSRNTRRPCSVDAPCHTRQRRCTSAPALSQPRAGAERATAGRVCGCGRFGLWIPRQV